MLRVVNCTVGEDEQRVWKAFVRDVEGKAYVMIVGLAGVLVAVNVLVLSWEVRVALSLVVAGLVTYTLTTRLHSASLDYPSYLSSLSSSRFRCCSAARIPSTGSAASAWAAGPS